MKIIAKVLFWIMKIRYNVTVENLPDFDGKTNYLVLPNHVAFVDPVLMWCVFRPYINIKPVVTSDFSKNPFLGWIFRLMGTITIEEFDKGKGGDKKQDQDKQIRDALKNLDIALEKGDSVLLYPSGRLMGQGKEYIGGKKSAFLTVQGLPKGTRVLTVRTTGLWGSRWSNAWSGGAPAFFGNLLRAIRYFITNLFFFVPKRKVTIHVEDNTRVLKMKRNLEKFNGFLEEYYNKNGEEEVSYIKNYFYYNNVKGKELPKHIRNSIESFSQVKEYDISSFPKDVIEDVSSIIREIKGLDKTEKISLESNLILELYCDSLDMAEIRNLILSKYKKASNTKLSDLKAVADLVAMALGVAANEEVELKPCDWKVPDELKKSSEWGDLDYPKTIPDVFKRWWKKDKNASLVYDSMFGMQTRNDVVLKAFLISEYLKEIPGTHIGVMFPALSSTTMLLLACYLAKKIPVMMNWTHPESGFEHCVKFSQTEKILTSRTFYKTINIEWLKKYDFVYLEDLLKDIPLMYKLKAAVKSLYFPLPKNLDETAVVLYTSGSESLPKAVPLSHRNIISEWRGTTGILNVHNDEVLFCYLPPFHSFGFTVNTMFPLLGGLRAVNTPDPNDSVTVSKLIEHTQPTILATTPTFLKNLLTIATEKQLSSLRYIITGGEKCSEGVFEKAREKLPKGIILEGYGITETSPIISINPLEKQKKGSVGIAIKGGDIKIGDLGDGKKIKEGEEGMIYYAGENVFRGYEDKSLESPFLKGKGKIWYKTGDLGYLDKEGYLFITGRMKRFLKLGGEMISLPFVEELLQEKYGSTEEINLAVEGKEKEDGVSIVLFVVGMKLDLKEVNNYLKSKGVSAIIQISEVRQIDHIPLLGTGKIDYKILKGMIE